MDATRLESLGALGAFVVQAVPGVRPLRLSIEGVTGAGKTESALAVAEALGGSVCVVSVGEYAAETIYASRYAFHRVDLEAVANAIASGALKHPCGGGLIGESIDLTASDPRLVAAVLRQVGQVFDVVVLDSLSEVWGRTLGLVDDVCAMCRTRSGEVDSREAWRRVTPAWDAVNDALMSVKAHTISTVRTKPVRDDKSKRVEDVPETRDRDRGGPDVIVRLDERHAGQVVKSRYSTIPMWSVSAPFDAVRMVAAFRSATNEIAAAPQPLTVVVAPPPGAPGSDTDGVPAQPVASAGAEGDLDAVEPDGGLTWPVFCARVAAAGVAGGGESLAQLRAWASPRSAPLHLPTQTRGRLRLAQACEQSAAVRRALETGFAAGDPAEVARALGRAVAEIAPTNSAAHSLRLPVPGEATWRAIGDAMALLVDHEAGQSPLHTATDAAVTALFERRAMEDLRSLRRDMHDAERPDGGAR